MDKVKVIKGYIKGMVKGYEELESDYKVFIIASLCEVLNFIDEIEEEWERCAEMRGKECD